MRDTTSAFGGVIASNWGIDLPTVEALGDLFVECIIAPGRAGDRAKGAVMASDAFFPFPDSVLEAVKAGIVAVVQPGGSVKDQEVIAAADEAGITMMLTGTRHFRH